MNRNAFTNSLWLVFSDDHLDGIILSNKEIINYLKKPRGYITKIQLDLEMNKYELQQLVNSVPKLLTAKLVGNVDKLSIQIQ